MNNSRETVDAIKRLRSEAGYVSLQDTALRVIPRYEVTDHRDKTMTLDEYESKNNTTLKNANANPNLPKIEKFDDAEMMDLMNMYGGSKKSKKR